MYATASSWHDPGLSNAASMNLAQQSQPNTNLWHNIQNTSDFIDPINSANPYYCEICMVNCGSCKQDFKLHLKGRKHKRKERFLNGEELPTTPRRLFPCQLCDKVFEDKKTFRAHCHYHQRVQQETNFDQQRDLRENIAQKEDQGIDSATELAETCSTTTGTDSIIWYDAAFYDEDSINEPNQSLLNTTPAPDVGQQKPSRWKDPHEVHYCEPCKISYANLQMFQEHLESQNHKMNEKNLSGSIHGGAAPRHELPIVSYTDAQDHTALPYRDRKIVTNLQKNMLEKISLQSEPKKLSTDTASTTADNIIWNDTSVYEEEIKKTYEGYQKENNLSDSGPLGGIDLRCQLCNVVCLTYPDYIAHISSAKHKETVASLTQMLNKKLERPIPQSDPKNIATTNTPGRPNKRKDPPAQFYEDEGRTDRLQQKLPEATTVSDGHRKKPSRWQNVGNPTPQLDPNRLPQSVASTAAAARSTTTIPDGTTWKGPVLYGGEGNKSQLQQRLPSATPGGSKQWMNYCRNCNISCTDVQNFREHLASLEHKKMVHSQCGVALDYTGINTTNLQKNVGNPTPQLNPNRRLPQSVASTAAAARSTTTIPESASQRSAFIERSEKIAPWIAFQSDKGIKRRIELMATLGEEPSNEVVRCKLKQEIINIRNNYLNLEKYKASGQEGNFTPEIKPEVEERASQRSAFIERSEKIAPWIAFQSRKGIKRRIELMAKLEEEPSNEVVRCKLKQEIRNLRNNYYLNLDKYKASGQEGNFTPEPEVEDETIILQRVARTTILMIPVRTDSKIETDPVKILRCTFGKKFIIESKDGLTWEVRVDPLPDGAANARTFINILTLTFPIATCTVQSSWQGERQVASQAVEWLKEHCTRIEPNPEWFKNGETPDFIKNRIPCNKNPRSYIILTKEEVGPINDETASTLLNTFLSSNNDEMYFPDTEFFKKEKILLMNQRSKFHDRLGFRHFGSGVMFKDNICIYKKKSPAEIIKEARDLEWKHPKYIIYLNREDLNKEMARWPSA